MRKENGLVNWEHLENLLNDKVYQSAKKILKECIEIENTFDDIIKKIKQKKLLRPYREQNIFQT